MRRRPSARLIVLDRDGRVLLFRFVHKTGALAGLNHWATPGGAVEDGETFEQAAMRELHEETGIRVDTVGHEIARRTFVLQLADGEHVEADERFFLVRVLDKALSREGWTPDEIEIMTDHRWWTREALSASSETIFPENLLAILEGIGGGDRG
ncbi:MAG TPA: NUDIX domain-containing protein [Rhizomicrobium sp.]|nr:NUDIX domain-containing protein [Rhizomicrobium sp.]